MTISRFILLCLSTMVLAACSSLDRQINSGFSAQPLDLSTNHAATLRKMIINNVTGVEPCFANSTGGAPPEADCVSKRNQVISILMSESIYLCSEHLNSIYGREAAFNIATGSIAALSSGFAAVSTAARASTLSALSAFATSERSLVNETIYKSILTPAIGTKISQLREQKGSALLRRKTESIQAFGLEDAINEVLVFHDSCSFRVGLQVALAEGTQTTAESKRAQLEAKALQLMNQINAYATVKKIESTAYALDNDGTTKKIFDPFLRSLIDQYLAVSRGVQDLLPVIGTKSANSIPAKSSTEVSTPQTSPKSSGKPE